MIDNPFDSGLLQRMRRFFGGDGDIRECICGCGALPEVQTETPMPPAKKPKMPEMVPHETTVSKTDYFDPADSLPGFEDLNGPVTADRILKAGLYHMENRASTYDAAGGERSMEKTVALFNIWSGLQLTEEQGWMFMVFLKATRSSQGGYKCDNYEDGSAYFGLAAEAGYKERNRGRHGQAEVL